MQAQLLRASGGTTTRDIFRQQLTLRNSLMPSLTHRVSKGFEYPFMNIGGNNENCTRSHFSQVDGIGAPRPSPLSEQPVNQVEINSDDEYDGRIHSFPYKKNGPYTCSKCMQVFDTSQRFAAYDAAFAPAPERFGQGVTVKVEDVEGEGEYGIAHSSVKIKSEHIDA
ncbi:hypothetical protein RJT34_07751 [Clitoria ternatea]|uniref:Uncharacterized protein n=1 Tax=Clitoria ternatea TaxID=43366 RepID=A0AAN9K4T5_CLITE